MKKVSCVLFFVTFSLFAQPVVWNASSSYSTGALVIVGSTTYIATTDVPANNTPPNTIYWSDLAEAATALSMTADSLEALPTTAVSDLLDTLPDAAPDSNSSSSVVKFQLWETGKAYEAGALVVHGSNTYLAKKAVPSGHSPPNANYWNDLNQVALRMGVAIEEISKISTEKILQSNPLNWDSQLGYVMGSLVIHNGNSYIAKLDVPVGQNPSVSSYWTNLADAAIALAVPIESIPTLSVETILASLPSQAPNSENSGTHSSTLSVWDTGKTYRAGELVIIQNETYIAKITVPAGATPPDSNYWTSLSDAATQLKVPISMVPNIDTATILASLPNAAPVNTHHKIYLSSLPESAGTLSGGGAFPNGNPITLSASPRPGYLFKEWNMGSRVSVMNPNQFTVSEDLNITAHFEMDLGDDDADGLTNYQELATYGTAKDSNDTDNDGFSDSFEVEIGTNPLVSDSQLVDYISKNPTEFSLVEKTKYDQAMNAYPAQDTNSTPYTSEWFYLPNRGWMWTNNSTFPYFFDQNTSDWLHFENGNTKPTFYEYKTKKWIRIE
jgi:hypothetical protein